MKRRTPSVVLPNAPLLLALGALAVLSCARAGSFGPLQDAATDGTPNAEPDWGVDAEPDRSIDSAADHAVYDVGRDTLAEDALQDSSLPDVFVNRCGDGRRVSPEECDDRNTRDADGCSALCMVEKGWRCDEDELSVCTLIPCSPDTVNVTAPGVRSVEVPVNCTTVVAHLWGGGGGSSAARSNVTGGLGGGGAYVQVGLTVDAPVGLRAVVAGGGKGGRGWVVGVSVAVEAAEPRCCISVMS